MTRAVLAAISFVVLGLAAAPSLAQTAGDYSDTELRSFVVAAAKVQQINDAYLPKLRAAKTDEETKRVQETANAEMKRALDEEGISVDRFQEIVAQARADRALIERIREQLRQVRSEVRSEVTPATQ